MKNLVLRNNIFAINTTKVIKKLLVTAFAIVFVLQMFTISAIARPLENDFHTDTWDRFSYNYEFYSGVDYSEELGRPTQKDIAPCNEATENVRRNAGSSFNPPPSGFFSGDFPTERNNMFANQSPVDYARNTTNFADSGTMGMGFGGSDVSGGGSPYIASVGSGNSGGQMLPPTSIMSNNNSNNNQNQGSNVTITERPPATVTQRPNPDLNHVPAPLPQPNLPNPSITTPITAPTFFYDGSMGRLSIPRIGLLESRVFHGSGYNIIDFHIGHFPTTSAWDGNIGLLAHNGGSAGYFQNLHLLSIGNEIVFTTPQGTRVYEVVFSTTIHETDFSLLGWSHENMITLITCVRGNQPHRTAVVAVQR